jgi:hypothetical protein
MDVQAAAPRVTRNLVCRLTSCQQQAAACTGWMAAGIQHVACNLMQQHVTTSPARGAHNAACLIKLAHPAEVDEPAAFDQKPRSRNTGGQTACSGLGD